jgi:aconitase B
MSSLAADLLERMPNEEFEKMVAEVQEYIREVEYLREYRNKTFRQPITINIEDLTEPVVIVCNHKFDKLDIRQKLLEILQSCNEIS